VEARVAPLPELSFLLLLERRFSFLADFSITAILRGVYLRMFVAAPVVSMRSSRRPFCSDLPNFFFPILFLCLILSYLSV